MSDYTTLVCVTKKEPIVAHPGKLATSLLSADTTPLLFLSRGTEGEGNPASPKQTATACDALRGVRGLLLAAGHGKGLDEVQADSLAALLGMVEENLMGVERQAKRALILENYPPMVWLKGWHKAADKDEVGAFGTHLEMRFPPYTDWVSRFGKSEGVESQAVYLPMVWLRAWAGSVGQEEREGFELFLTMQWMPYGEWVEKNKG